MFPAIAELLELAAASGAGRAAGGAALGGVEKVGGKKLAGKLGKLGGLFGHDTVANEPKSARR